MENSNSNNFNSNSNSNHFLSNYNDNPNPNHVSNLSTALRNIHIKHGADQDSNINSKSENETYSGGLRQQEYYQHQQLQQAQERAQIEQEHIQTNYQQTSYTGQHSNNTNFYSNYDNNNNSNSTNKNSNDINVIDNSRLIEFFQNQPMSGYTLFSHRSAPNGFKVAIVLSELGLHYNTFYLDFNKGEHRAPEFISITPNARVPALIDHSLDNLSIWESGAILIHLVNKYYKETGKAKLWSNDLSEQSQINAWLFFQTTGHAPMIGQALHFTYFHSERVPSALERYTDEVRRVYGVIEMALAEKREALVMELDTENATFYSAGTTPLSQSKFFDYPVWLACDKITIADLSFVPWNNVVDRIGINLKLEFPEVYKWTRHMMRRPAVSNVFRSGQ